MRIILRHSKRNFSFLILFLTVIILLALLPNFALGASGDVKFSAGTMATLGTGPMGNGTDVPNRAMLFTNLSAFAGVSYKRVRLGANYEYYYGSQITDTPDISGQNLTGSGTVPGIRLDYYDGLQALGVIYRMGDIYVLSSATIQGLNTTYKAKSGYTAQYYRRIKNNLGFVIDYTMEEYDNSLTNKIKWNRIGLGIVFTNFLK